MFTTHTPVPAGIDRFGADQIETYFGGDNAVAGRAGRADPRARRRGLPRRRARRVQHGRHGPAPRRQRANGVSQLHGVVSRDMFDGLWPGFDDAEVPITWITNGVHAPTWVDRKVFELAEQAPRARTDLERDNAWERIGGVPGDEIWATKREMRAQLVEEARRRVRSSWLKRGASPAELGWVDDILDPDVLTIGFARRVPTYKRLTLMLRDPDAAASGCCCDPTRPVQIVIAGKSHPADDNGKRLIQQMVRFADDPEVRHRIVVPARTTTSPWRSTSTRAATSG